MRIGVNLLSLRPAVMGGAEVYARDLLDGLLKAGRHEYVLVAAADSEVSLPHGCRHVRLGGVHGLRSVRRLTSRVGWLRGRIPLLRERIHAGMAADLHEVIRRERLDLWFCPFTDLHPRVCPVPAVITVHDLQHEYYPEFFSPEELRHRRAFYPESCAVADHVIAVSEFTRRCVQERYGVEPTRVSTVWEAAGADLDWGAAPARVGEIRRAYNLPDTYLFYPANTWPHKNHSRLLEALATLRAHHGNGLGLVLAGARVDDGGALEALITLHRLHDAVRVLGYVPRPDLPALYAGAVSLVLPSLFEGFGIPLVEAMQVGCPIVAAKVASIPEIVGDAAVLFDPLDPEDMARALAEVSNHPACRADLARRGRARAALFSVATMAQQTLEIFERTARDADVRPVAIGIDGIYGDRWMGSRASVSLRGPVSSLEIEGDVPAHIPVRGQGIVIRVPGRKAMTVPLNAVGGFSVVISLDQNGRACSVWEISVVSRRTFCPRRHGISPDDRKLSVQLCRLRVRTWDGREIVKILGSA